LSETKDAIDRKHRVDEPTTEIIDTGNKFAYDTIALNGERVFALKGEATTEIGEANKATKTTEDGEQSSPEPSTNIINENNEKQESAIDISNDIKTQMEGSSKAHIGDVDTKSNRRLVGSTTPPPTKSTSERHSLDSMNETSATGNTSTSTEKGPNDFEIKKFISEHIKFKSNNVTIKKSWSKWSPWSSCSRSCGEGVMSQSRECTEKM
jgi:Thrombospondin type 1 domain